MREVDAGAWQGLLGGGDRPALAGRARRLAARLRTSGWGAGRPHRAGLRVATAVERHAATVEDNLLVASHGAALKAAVVRLVGLPVTAAGALAGFRNCHWAVLVRAANAWVLEEYNAGAAGPGWAPRGDHRATRVVTTTGVRAVVCPRCGVGKRG